jgi:hypothetical protein
MDELGSQVRPMIQTSFLNKGAVIQDDSSPLSTAGMVQSWFEEHEGELQYLALASTITDLNINEPLLHRL